MTVTGSDTLVMYTRAGDANLDGKINIDDYGIIDSNISQQGGVVFPTAGSTAGDLDGVAAVPEPASLSLLALGAAGLLRRRRRAGGVN